RRPQQIAPVHRTSDSAAAIWAHAGVAAATSHRPTDLNGHWWKAPALITAAASRTSVSRKAGWLANSVAWAANIMKPVGTTRPKPRRAHVSRCAARALT